MKKIPNTTKRRKKIVTEGHTDDGRPRQRLGIFAQRRCPSAAVLGENSKHGEQLRQLTRCAFRKGHEALRCRVIVSDGEIATMTNAQKYGNGVDVLIRADGGVDRPFLKQALPRASLSRTHTAARENGR